MPNALVQRLRHVFQEQFHRKPKVSRAPGRINLIGEHTDYNDGFVLPMGIDRYVAVAFAPREEHRFRVYAPEYDEMRTVLHADLEPGQENGWIDYVVGVAWALQQEGYSLPGADLAVLGNVPIGAGLSSSAALEVACGRAFSVLGDIPWNPVTMATIGRRAENDYVGVSCGIMDQFAAALSKRGHAMLLDCRSLERTYVSLPPDVRPVIMDTGVRRSLTDSAYNERTQQCQQAVRELAAVEPSIRALRDVTPEILRTHEERLDPLVYRRAKHVVEENERTLRAADLLPSDPAGVGRLMNQSHESLRDLYEVSSRELDVIVAAARNASGCFGARLTGAGMGGCAIALVEADAVEEFTASVTETYNDQVAYEAEVFATRASGGVRLMD